MVPLYQFFYCKKFLQKRWFTKIIICGRPWPFNNEKPFAFIICGKCMVEMFGFTSMSSSGLISFKKSYFNKKCYQIWWKKQAKIWQYVLHMLVECKFTTINVDLWMSKGTHDVFSFLINLLVIVREPKNIIIIELFELAETTKHAFVIT